MWCLLGTLVMVVWLMAPVAKCSWAAFRDTPLSETQPSLTPSETDTNRVEQSDDFFSKLATSVKGCYAETPLLGQEDWKTYLLIGFVALTAITWGLAIWDARRRKTFER
jgi:hypothetical protein